MKQKHKVIIKDIKQLKDAMNHPADYEHNEDLQRKKAVGNNRDRKRFKE